jgi:indolepyruvate ferredoxin oxidoreductase beta subunit
MQSFNIYLTGVGGQGIGLLSEVLMRAADHAGLPVQAVDTHGLAQRGGVVISNIRVGDSIYSPLIGTGEADMVVALERHEALRGMNTYLKDAGTLLYYNTTWQPLEVRLNQAPAVTSEIIADECLRRRIKSIVVFKSGLRDVRMQNTVVLARIAADRLVPDVAIEHYRMAFDDLLGGTVRAKNLGLFDAEVQAQRQPAD